MLCQYIPTLLFVPNNFYCLSSVCDNTPVVLTHAILKLQVAVHMRAVTIEDLMDPVRSTLGARQTMVLAFGTFQDTVGAFRHMTTLTAGHAAKV